jgi:hypothetical protein
MQRNASQCQIIMTHFLSLPHEIITHILYFLRSGDIQRLALTFN